MASRKELKEQRRRAREEAERRERERARRRTRLRALGVAGAVAALAAAAGGAVLLGAFEQDPEDVFGPKPEGLAERVEEAQLTYGADHFHPTIRLVANGSEIPIPVDLGVAPAGGQHAPIHLHAGDEQLHAEGLEEGTFTLGQFMTVWGVPLTPTRLGPYRENGDRRVMVFVKRRGEKRFTETDAFADLQLRDADEVYLVYGTPEESPIAL
jgi:hypothetical protein